MSSSWFSQRAETHKSEPCLYIEDKRRLKMSVSKVLSITAQCDDAKTLRIQCGHPSNMYAPDGISGPGYITASIMF